MRLLSLPEVLVIAEAVATIQSLAAGNITEEQLSDWIRTNTKQRQ